MRQTIGIIGGGQLARMTAQAASGLGVDTRILAADSSDPACSVAGSVVVGEPDELATLERFAVGCDVVTFDHERVDPLVVSALEASGAIVRPSAPVLALADKAHQRVTFAAAGVPVPPFALAASQDELVACGRRFGWPLVAKWSVGGYDGRGVAVLADERAAASIVAFERPLVVEPLLDVVAELAVLVVRRPSGETVAYPTVETVQRDGICIETIVPATVHAAAVDAARRTALELAAEIGAVGVLAVELFVTPDGVVLNEIAPRPHNSGHWTIHGSTVSQFENHVRAVLDLPLGAADLRAPAVATVNVLGARDGSDPADRLAAGLSVRGAHVHLYGKRARPGRKLGHVTAAGADPTTASTVARAARDALIGEEAR